MSKLCNILILLVISLTIQGATLEGKVNYKKGEQKGVLFIFARAHGVKRGPPMAVKRVNNPTFPLSFKLSKEDAMIPGTPFAGPFTLSAKFSTTGDAMDPNAKKVSTTTPVKIDSKDIILELK